MDEKQFSLQLAQLITKRGVSARDMSLSMGQNPGYINNIENGKSYPSLSGIFYICDYLEMSPAEFFDVSTDDPVQIKDLVEDLKQLDEQQRKTIAALVKDMAHR